MINFEIDTTARTIWAECRSGGDVGMSAVADVICNRVAIAKLFIEHHGHYHPTYGNGTFIACCKAPLQFSCWNSGDPNLSKLLAVTSENAQFSLALSIAAQAVGGTLIDSTQAATHYKTIGSYALWAVGHTPCAIISGQEFYNDVN